jgi:type I restriction enzyme M protein
MRMLVHYHAYGDAEAVPGLVAEHGRRLRAQISQREQEEVERLEAEYQEHAEKLAELDHAIAKAQNALTHQMTKTEKKTVETALRKLESQRTRPAAKVAERDERIAEAHRRAEDDRQEIISLGEELMALYDDPDALLKHAHVVSLEEIEENEFNLNIPRYVDTFEPEPWVDVGSALRALAAAEGEAVKAEKHLKELLRAIGYAN